MYFKSLVVFVLCTIFVAAFFAAISYDTSGIGKQSPVVVTNQTPCSPSKGLCETIAMTSASLRTVNYTDELGTVDYAVLTVGLTSSGPSTISAIELFVGNSSAGSVQGPFEPGVTRTVNLTLPATISVSPGVTYVVSAEGLYGGSSSTWASTTVTAT